MHSRVNWLLSCRVIRTGTVSIKITYISNAKPVGENFSKSLKWLETISVVIGTSSVFNLCSEKSNVG